ncbi:adenosine receptor A3-like [Acropora millepora]|uniref:adenosine receptor A3-like n=1 Tax=Acropora millepora TaxID=45264 RepID=UPI001CF54D89|nr:adenosine receptor A3-like [Acropora millepora]
MAGYDWERNKTSLVDWFSPAECIAWAALFGMEAVVIAMLNALTIFIYLKERSLRKRSMYLVINLAVADMFVGAGSSIIEGLLLGNDCGLWTIDNFNQPPALVITVLQRSFPLASIANLAAISFERTQATFLPFKHRLIGKKTFLAAAVAIWMAAGLCSASLLLQNVVPVRVIEFRRGFYITYLSFFSFCLLTILVSYSSIAIKIVFGNQPRHHGATSRERKLTKTLFIVTVVSLMLALPQIVFFFCDSVSQLRNFLGMVSVRTRYFYRFFFKFFFYANSLVNPVVYAFRIPDFKRALLSVLRCEPQRESAQIFPLYVM